MEKNSDLSRFTEAYQRDYDLALREIRAGRKESHWMWYIFPQFRGLGHSSLSQYYAIGSIEEASAFLRDPYLGLRLKEICHALLQLETNDPREVFYDPPDDKKLRSSMTLFAQVADGDDVFQNVLDKYFAGKQDGRTLSLLNRAGNGVAASGGETRREPAVHDTLDFDAPDDNIISLRAQYPDGLHFVVGDTHGETETLTALMQKILFDPTRDHVYFVGDYNGGGNVQRLLRYIATAYEPDPTKPGFHLIRGNHERDSRLYPAYPLCNLPDIYVLRGRGLNYFIAHAGMVRPAFTLIVDDLNAHPQQTVFTYRLAHNTSSHNLLRQITWSRNGLYSQNPRWKVWTSETQLRDAHACIIHGHAPYCYFRGPGNHYSDKTLFFTRQHAFFSQALQSFNIDSNVKGRNKNGETYRGLSCVCLEVYDEIAAKNGNQLTREAIMHGPNGIFAVQLTYDIFMPEQGDIDRILNAVPQMTRIGLDNMNNPVII